MPAVVIVQVDGYIKPSNIIVNGIYIVLIALIFYQ